MTATAILSLAGAPGVSTLIAAIAATVHDDASLLVAEAGPGGGVVAARWGWPRAGSLAAVAMDTGTDQDLWSLAHPWLGSCRILTGDPSPTATRHAQVGGWLADRLDRVEVDVLIDAGRLDASADQLALLSAVGRVWVLVDPTVAQVTTATAIRGWLSRTGPVGVLVREHTAGPGRYRADEVAATVGWPLVATVPTDVRAAAVLCGHTAAPRTFRTAPLIRTGGFLADTITTADTGVAA